MRDTPMWNQCLIDATKMYRVDEPDQRCFHLADATWKCKMSYINHAEKKNQNKLIVIDKTPSLVNDQRKPKHLCCATTMKGKPCAFKAICGNYCKKHTVKETNLGTKVVLSIIK